MNCLSEEVVLRVLHGRAIQRQRVVTFRLPPDRFAKVAAFTSTNPFEYLATVPIAQRFVPLVGNDTGKKLVLERWYKPQGYIDAVSLQLTQDYHTSQCNGCGVHLNITPVQHVSWHDERWGRRTHYLRG